MLKTKPKPEGLALILKKNSEEIQKWPAWMRRAAGLKLKTTKRKTVDFKKYRVALAQEEDDQVVIKIFYHADNELLHYFRVSGHQAIVSKGRHTSTLDNPDN